MRSRDAMHSVHDLRVGRRSRIGKVTYEGTFLGAPFINLAGLFAIQ